VAAGFRSEPHLVALLDYWEAKRGARAMPRRRDVDPLDMPPGLLPHLELIELSDGRLRYRLVGTAIVDAMGRDATGRYLDQVLDGEHLHFIARFLHTVVQSGRPVFGRCRLRCDNGGDVKLRRMAVPLATDSGAVRMMLTATSLGAGQRSLSPPLAASSIAEPSIEVL
jgi:hypothetical protein